MQDQVRYGSGSLLTEICKHRYATPGMVQGLVPEICRTMDGTGSGSLVTEICKTRDGTGSGSLVTEIFRTRDGTGSGSLVTEICSIAGPGMVLGLVVW
jgi:hypothetical protein